MIIGPKKPDILVHQYTLA